MNRNVSSVNAAWRMVLGPNGEVLTFFAANKGSRTYSLHRIVEISFGLLPGDMDEEKALERALADKLYSTADNR